MSAHSSVHGLQEIRQQMDPGPSGPHFIAPPRNSSDSFQRSREGLQFCDIAVRDDVDYEELRGVTTDNLSLYSEGGNVEGLKRILLTRDHKRSRWVNVKGWSRETIDEISKAYLGGHDCLDFKDISEQGLGSLTQGGGCSAEFIWIQSQVWFSDGSSNSWAAMKSDVRFIMVLCLPTDDSAGTLITNFVSPRDLVERISTICTNQIYNHPLSVKSLQCVWIVAFAIVRAFVERVDFAFNIFNPLNVAAGTMNFEEIYGPETVRTQKEKMKNRNWSWLEGNRVQGKIRHQQKLCGTFVRQYENLVQLAISMSTTDIIDRLDASRNTADQFTKIGMIIAGIACVIAPMSLLVGFYGMNVKEFIGDSANITMYDVSKVGIPMLLVIGVCSAFFAIWLSTNKAEKAQR